MIENIVIPPKPYLRRMKQLLFLLLLAPMWMLAQDHRTNLNDYGLNAFMHSDSAVAVERIEQKQSYLETNEIKIYLENGEKITITELNKKMSIATIKAQFNKLLSTQHKGITLKALVKSGNDLLIERTYKDSGRKIYKFMVLCVIKGKEYMIEGSEMDEEALCRQVMKLAKTIR